MTLYHGKTTQELSNFIKILKELILWEVFLLIKQRWRKMSFTLIFSQEESGLQQEHKGSVNSGNSLTSQTAGRWWLQILFLQGTLRQLLFSTFWRRGVFYERCFPEVYGFLTLEEPGSCIANRCQVFIPNEFSSGTNMNNVEQTRGWEIAWWKRQRAINK